MRRKKRKCKNKFDAHVNKTKIKLNVPKRKREREFLREIETVTSKTHFHSACTIFISRLTGGEKVEKKGAAAAKKIGSR